MPYKHNKITNTFCLHKLDFTLNLFIPAWRTFHHSNCPLTTHMSLWKGSWPQGKDHFTHEITRCYYYYLNCERSLKYREIATYTTGKNVVTFQHQSNVSFSYHLTPTSDNPPLPSIWGLHIYIYITFWVHQHWWMFWHEYKQQQVPHHR